MATSIVLDLVPAARRATLAEALADEQYAYENGFSYRRPWTKAEMDAQAAQNRPAEPTDRLTREGGKIVTPSNVTGPLQIGQTTLQRYKGRVVVPGTTVSLLSNPKKLRGYSFGLPAVGSCPWAVFHKSAEGEAICGFCYARKGSYVWPRVTNAYDARYRWVRACMKSEAGRREFVEYMTAAIGRTRGEYFRIHDSGDFFNEAYVQCWAEVVRRLPGKRFWAPTRGWQARNPWRAALQALAAEPNATVRPSALFFNAPAPRVDGFAAGATATEEAGFNCPAPTQGNSCGDCRKCWTAPNVEISYHRH